MGDSEAGGARTILWGTAQEPQAAAAPSTSEIASAIVRLLFTFPSIVPPRHDEGAEAYGIRDTPSVRGPM